MLVAIFSKYWWFQTKWFTRLLELIQLYKQNPLENIFIFKTISHPLAKKKKDPLQTYYYFHKLAAASLVGRVADLASMWQAFRHAPKTFLKTYKPSGDPQACRKNLWHACCKLGRSRCCKLVWYFIERGTRLNGHLPNFGSLMVHVFVILCKYTGWPPKNRTVDTVDFSELCSDQQLSISPCWIEHLFLFIITPRSSNVVENFLFYE